MAQSRIVTPSGEIVNTSHPFHELSGFITPSDKFYVRSHFPCPSIDAAAWRLQVEGAVERPFELTYQEVTALEEVMLPATLECAGNSRMHLQPPVKGLQWDRGAVSNAEWTGASLASVLERAGVRSGAVEVIFEGWDSGVLQEHPAPAAPMPFAFSIPLERAQKPSTLLAYRMNGEALSVSHGFPVRALVPGYYAMASVKWLRRIIVTETRFHGYFQTIDYSRWRTEHGILVRTPLSLMPVKSQISRPAPGDSLLRNTSCKVLGAAWTGDAQVEKVEVSWDGLRWLEARLLGEPRQNSWRLWECETTTPRVSGRYHLACRATDSAGNTQPVSHDYNNCNYSIHHVIPVEVDVR
jgi:DMSO/TMAO reductase YedYZ molybdopterin-dependent catalytic subunit